MVSITFYGGVKEIGGNKILVKDGDASIFLDFGMSFGKVGKYFEEYLKPRTAAGMEDYLEMGLLPDLKGIYRSDHLKMIGREPEEPEIDAVFISHAHADHVNYVTFLHEDIPIHCGETCHNIIEAVSESGGRKIDFEIIDFKKRPILNQKDEAIKRKFEKFRTGKKIKVGNMEIEPIHVDHSVPGAYGFIVYTSDGTIAYTGDMRVHGSNSEMTMDFINKAAGEDIDALITEGTRIDQIERSSEKEVYEKCDTEISKTNKVVFADFNFKDVDRLRTFVQLAEKHDRKFVIGFKEACLLKRYSEDGRLKVPRLDDDRIIIYKARKGTGTYIDKDYGVCEREYYKGSNVWSYDEILQNQDKLLVFLNFWNLNNLIDMKPKPESLFIHSLSEAFNEEMEISEKRENNWIEHFELRKIQAHCSGHANGKELKELIEKISAKEIYPVHTEHPGMFRDLSSKIKIVKEGKAYVI